MVLWLVDIQIFKATLGILQRFRIGMLGTNLANNARHRNPVCAGTGIIALCQTNGAAFNQYIGTVRLQCEGT